MPVAKKIILAYTLLTLTACAAGPVAPPSSAVVGTPSSASQSFQVTPIHDPDQGLKVALDAYKAGEWNAALGVAQEVMTRYPGTAWHKRSLFLAEQAFIKLDRAAEADAAMNRVEAEYPVLADYALFILAEYHYSKARFAQAAALYEKLGKRYPRSSLAIRAAYRRAQALFESNAYVPAAEAFDKFLQDNPRSEFCADAGLGLGRALTAWGEPARAVRAYREVLVKCPGTPADPDVEKALAAFRANGIEVPELTPEELYERGKNLFAAYQYAKAAEAYTKLLALAPSFPDKPDILVRTGVCLFNLGRRAEAAAGLEQMVRDCPRSQLVPEALYWLGKSYNRLGERDKAIQAFRTILDSYPSSEWADDALYLTGNIYRDTNELKKALSLYGQLAAEYPDSKFADSAYWWKAWAYYGAGDYRKSAQTLGELINHHPRSSLVNQALYWQGRATEKNGEPLKAAAYYRKVQKRAPYSYYGYRAVERLQGLEVSGAQEKTNNAAEADPCENGPCPDDPPAADDPDDGPPVWTTEALKTLSRDPSFTKALELLYLNMKKESASELVALQARLPKKRGALLGLSKTYFELGDYYHSLALVLKNYERYLDGNAATPQDFWLLAYPQGYWESIVSYSRRYGQDPYFIAAIIRAESQFRAEALSPAGARGVMQVMPATGTWVAKTIRVAGFAPDRLFDSDTAINIGTWYIGHLMKRFKGDALFTAAAYNAGPDAVSAWLSKNGYGTERDEFVEAIPFSETRGYVKRVMRNYAEYRRIYAKADQGASLVPAKGKGTISPLVESAGVKKP